MDRHHFSKVAYAGSIPAWGTRKTHFSRGLLHAFGAGSSGFESQSPDKSKHSGGSSNWQNAVIVMLSASIGVFNFFA